MACLNACCNYLLPFQGNSSMKMFSQVALISALAFTFAGSAMAQSDRGAAADSAASAVKKPHHHKGTTLHQQDKASHLKGASAAAAASSLGTDDKGAKH